MVMIRCLILMLNLTLWVVAFFCQCVSSYIYVKNCIFEKCFRQSVKGKITAWDFRYYYDFIKIWTFQLNLRLTSRTLPYPPFVLTNSFYKRCVSCIYNISNISNTFNKYPIYPIYRRFGIFRLGNSGLRGWGSR